MFTHLLVSPAAALHFAAPTTPEQFTAYYDLRWRMLRAPWAQPRGSERDELDDADVSHMAAWDESGRLLGVGRLQLNTRSEAQIRFMAVEEDCQRQGVGQALVRRLEQIAREQGATSIILNARSTVTGFYERLGYTVVAQGVAMFEDSPTGPVEHTRMSKQL
ncbi:GNAT family N-acetyltransferase [Adhaeretor mobilis]|uniref:Acetyltransferase n=1 Tax=Adhaeretor mobilis TaxID=1930276 RepID=A0A517MPK1_9BACT|nr:GNAT family N-acetyltransferase [Adhaeretor mobilis]QDS96810.1 acetyltransferase [Adhaeretor mobilis]